MSRYEGNNKAHLRPKDYDNSGDIKPDNYDEENIEDVLEQIEKIRKETTKDGKVFTVQEKYR